MKVSAATCLPSSPRALRLAPSTRSSRHSAHALRMLCKVASGPIRCVLSDNGSEFMRTFEAELKKREITHWWTCPKSPGMNAWREHFNRTLQESFVDYCKDLLCDDVASFNQALAKWLVFTTPNVPARYRNCNPRYTPC